MKDLTCLYRLILSTWRCLDLEHMICCVFYWFSRLIEIFHKISWLNEGFLISLKCVYFEKNNRSFFLHIILVNELGYHFDSPFFWISAQSNFTYLTCSPMKIKLVITLIISCLVSMAFSQSAKLTKKAHLDAEKIMPKVIEWRHDIHLTGPAIFTCWLVQLEQSRSRKSSAWRQLKSVEVRTIRSFVFHVLTSSFSVRTTSRAGAAPDA